MRPNMGTRKCEKIALEITAAIGAPDFFISSRARFKTSRSILNISRSVPSTKISHKANGAGSNSGVIITRRYRPSLGSPPGLAEDRCCLEGHRQSFACWWSRRAHRRKTRRQQLSESSSDSPFGLELETFLRAGLRRASPGNGDLHCHSLHHEGGLDGWFEPAGAEISGNEISTLRPIAQASSAIRLAVMF